MTGRYVVAVLLALAGCQSGSSTTPTTTSGSVPPSASTSTPAATTSMATTTTASTVATTTTTIPGLVQQVEVGRSVEGRPIVAIERGTPGGTKVLVVGVIHGDEDAGVAIIDRLLTAPVPAGVDLWLVPSMNPDGQAAERRTNANLVDLNRNFPRRWAPLGHPGDWQYGGTGPASEPETQAMVAFIERLQPDLSLWYHQDFNRIAPASGRAGHVRRQYAELTGLPVLPVTGGSYSGTASPWAQAASPGSVSFIIELGPTLSPEQADTHAAAVLNIAEDN